MKMVANFAESDGPLNKNQLEHSIRRNFGGFEDNDPMKIFQRHCDMTLLKPQEDGRPPVDSIGLIRSCLTGEDTALKGMESRYMLILTENLSVLSIIMDEFDSHGLQPEVVFGSKFRDDVSYTKVCHNIYRIKTCMDKGKQVILLNLDDLYESLYDALNQNFATLGKKKFVDIGLGTHRVKSFVNDEFRLVVIADQKKVHSKFPIALINRLEKHFISAASLLNEKQKELKAELEKWADMFFTPQRFYAKMCPPNCDGCNSVLNQPYKLNCQHYIGSCCKERIQNGNIEKKCPKCGEIITLDHWEIDIDGLRNKQYFERSAEETAFIGYNKETTALVVSKVTKEHPSEEKEQLLEHCKFHLLQCATPESVLRLDKTQLVHEAEKIQKWYTERQHHEILLEYLHHELPQAGNSLFAQVTTFAEVLDDADIRQLAEAFSKSGQSIEIQNILLMDISKEDQFSDAISKFYGRQSRSNYKLLLIQCGSSAQDIELLDSVRFIIQRESEAIKKRENVAIQTHTVLLLSLSRGESFKGYQGGKWKCVHIDDPKQTYKKLPLSKCLQYKPSGIIKKVITQLLDDKASSAVQQYTDEGTQNQQLVEESDQTGSVHQKNEGIFENMMPFIMQCLPAAVSVIKVDKIYDRVQALRDLLSRNEVFVKIFLKHVYTLLLEQEELNQNFHWVKSDAAKASNMKQSETMRNSLEDALERAFVPALAAVISFIDVRQNLLILLDQGSSLRSLWLQIFEHCDDLGLNFAKITNGQQSKLPLSYKVQQTGSGPDDFAMKMPFSWIAMETINNLAKANPKLGDVSIQQQAEQFRLSPIGKIILANFTERLQNEILDGYLSDFVHVAYPCTNELEHEIVSRTLFKLLGGQSLSLAEINATYSRHQAVFTNLSAVFSLVDKHSELFAKVNEGSNTDATEPNMPCDLLALSKLLTMYDEIKRTELRNKPEKWMEQVDRSKLVVEQVFKSHIGTSSESFNNCRTMWLRVSVKKLYVEHIASTVPADGKWKAMGSKELRQFFQGVDGKDFKKFKTFEIVIKLLRDALGARNRTLHPDCPEVCPRCEQPLDSPVKLECSHFMCDTCVTDAETEFCVCGHIFSESYSYDPAKDKIDPSLLNSLQQMRKGLNQFFMAFVSDVVFNGDDEPDEDITTWLLDWVTLKDGRKTQQLSVFNSAEVVDSSPVVRSFLLRLLLKCEQNNMVIKYFDQALLSSENRAPNLQMMALLIDCYKDMVNLQAPDIDKIAEYFEDDFTKVCSNPVTELDSNILRDIAEIQVYLSFSVEHLLTCTRGVSGLQKAVRLFLNANKSIKNSQPSYYIARQLLATHGEGYMNDLTNTQNSYLLPADVAMRLETFTVPDVMEAYGGDIFRQAKQALNNVFTEIYPSPEFSTALKQFTEVCNADESVMIQVLFSRVTRCFAQSIPVAQEIRDAIMSELEKTMENSKTLALLEMLLQDGRLPREMDVNQSSGINLSMLVLNLYSCLCSGGVMADLYPLSEIINQPDQAALHYFPTMPENSQQYAHEVLAEALKTIGENATLYECPNGHPYVVGDCGRPYYRYECQECGVEIGGSHHVAADGNRALDLPDSANRTESGHILGQPANRTPAFHERDLNLLSCAVMRCLTHLCMYTATLFNIEQVNLLIQPQLPSIEGVRPFLKAHIELDLQQISQCCAESTDDCILLIHDVINRMRQASLKNERWVLDSLQKRVLWEQLFDTKFMRPTLSNTAEVLHGVKSKIEKGDIKTLLSTTERPLDNANIISSAGLWEYKRPLTLEAIQNVLGSTDNNHPILKDIVDNCHVLMAVKHLPDVLTLIKSLNDKFHSRFSRTDAKMRINDFCTRYGNEIPNLKNMISSFQLAWNSVYKYLESNGKQLSKLNDRSALSNFLIDQQRGAHSVPYQLVMKLTEIHNSRLSFCSKERPKVPLSAVTPTNIIGIESSDEILSLIASHSEYELRETTAITYNWPAIEREVLHRYISNKPRIECSRDQLPCYVYQEDFNLHNQMQAISDSQKMLTQDQEDAIVNALPAQVKELTQYLKQLKVVINFLSVMKPIDGDYSLLEYMKTTFQKTPSYLPKDIKLKHVIHVWLVVKYTQTDLLMRKHQEPFDDIHAECREPLSKPVIANLNNYGHYNSPTTKVLLQQIFNYIILRLNKEAMQQFSESPEMSLHNVLVNFVMESFENEEETKMNELLEKLPALPNDIKIKHVSRAWSQLWERYSKDPQ